MVFSSGCSSFMNIEMQQKINSGQGEYLVFLDLPLNQKFVSKELYERVYAVFKEYSIFGLIEKNALSLYENRYEIIKNHLKEMDPKLEIVFIPQTLYEILFITKGIQEDLENGFVCSCESTLNYHAKLIKDCYHMGCHENNDFSDETSLRDLAFKVNQAAIKILSPTKEGFSIEKILDSLEKQIAFLKNYYLECQKKQKLLEEGKKVSLVYDVCSRGPTMNFGYDHPQQENLNDYSMTIRNEQDALIIKKAGLIECSDYAQKGIILYRGTNSLLEDNCARNSTPYSLSYGSLFGGCIYEPGASAFLYMRNCPYAYAIQVPFNQIKDGAIFVPNTSILVQLLSIGDTFHARSKAPRGSNIQKLGGIDGLFRFSYSHEYLICNLSQNEIIEQFNQIKEKAVILKQEDHENNENRSYN